jgi:hypothetical protein
MSTYREADEDQSASTGTPVAVSSHRFARSGQMVDCLRRELLYSDKRARDLVFWAIERLLAHHVEEPMIVLRLTREAARYAREEAENVGFAFASWETTSKAVVKAMAAAGALLAPDGSPIEWGIGAPASVVGRLDPVYRDATEAFLIELLIRRLGDVTTRDHVALAHALFRHFDPRVSMADFEDRVVILIARLASRVELRGELYSAK